MLSSIAELLITEVLTTKGIAIVVALPYNVTCSSPPDEVISRSFKWPVLSPRPLHILFFSYFRSHIIKTRTLKNNYKYVKKLEIDHTYLGKAQKVPERALSLHVKILIKVNRWAIIKASIIEKK